MTPLRLELYLWALTPIAAIGGLLVMHELLTPRVAETRPHTVQPTDDNSAAPGASKELVAKLIAADPFRRDRGRFDSTAITAPITLPKPPASPKPHLTLRGIVGGPPWDAIVEGLPNREGSYVVRGGDSVSGLKVRSVRPDRVTIRGMDTTWILKLDRAP